MGKTSRKAGNETIIKEALKFIKSEYLVAFLAMFLIILGAIAGEKLYPSRSPQSTQSQAEVITGGQGECTDTGCHCTFGYPGNCVVNHFYNNENNASSVSNPLNLGVESSEFSLKCGSEQINLALKKSDNDPWNVVADTTYISHARNCVAGQ